MRTTPKDLHLTGGKTINAAFAGPISLDNNPCGGLKGGFNCDEICKKKGQVCVGVGLTDPSKNACVYEVHDMKGVNEVPDDSCGTCKPKAAAGEKMHGL